jgi:hypothetical protein
MANWFTTGAGSIVSGLIGGVAKGINPYLGAAVEGGLGGFTAYQAARQEKRAFKKMGKAERASTRALPRLERSQKLLGMPFSRQVVPQPQTSTALALRSGANISSGFAGLMPGAAGVDFARRAADFAMQGIKRRMEERPMKTKTMFPPGELEEMSRAIDLRTKGTRALRPPAISMSNGGNLALMRRALMGGVTRREAPLFPGSENWAWPQGMSAVRFGPTGSAHYYRKRRRMNVLNSRALTRSMRRVQGFAKFARKTITFTSRVKMKKRRSK